MAAILNDSDGPTTTTIELPILQQNAVPGLTDITDAKEKYLHDMALRPDNVDEDDYNAVPIEDFGAAMLRGMGWVEGKGSDMAPILHKPRPNLLGLGAKPAPPLPGKKGRNGSSYSSTSSSKQQQQQQQPPPPPISSSSSSTTSSSSTSSTLRNSKEKTSIREGSHVRVTKEGQHNGKTGVIIGLKDKGREGIALKIECRNGEIVRCWDDEVVTYSK